MPKKDRQASRQTPGFTGPYKGAPQQGTLFDKRAVDQLPGNQATTADRIGPRGYSLNRSRQFNDVIGRPGFGKRSDQVTLHTKYRHAEPGESTAMGLPGSRHNTVPAVGEDEHPYQNAAVGNRRGRSKLVDTLARSTIPVEHLKGLGSIDVQPEGEYSGTYHRSIGEGFPAHINLNVTHTSERGEPPDYRLKQSAQWTPSHPDPEITLLHEIGHHVSNQSNAEHSITHHLATRDPEHHSEYRTTKQRAAEEGFADNYAMTHWKRDPRQQTWQGHFDPRGHTYKERGNIPGQQTAAYDTTMARKNDLPKRTTVTSDMERADRPMLSAGHPGVWDKTVKPEHVKGWGNDPEGAVYGRGMQRSNAAQAGWRNKKMTPERWQVRRGSMGRQF